ncbi:MAG TPA: ABC transporter ATP-binding protein [Planctomycetota bacterium]|nr:ABC transporter ATP-binding protein [Planctomycetota bacterium]
MSYLALEQVTKRYANGFQAVKRFDLSVRQGAFVVFLGPSGCGKTTTLRMIAGLEEVSGGAISLAGRRIETLRPADRDIAFVFQFFALYPHLTVRENMEFPLRAQGMRGAEIATRVDETARMLGIAPLLTRKPGTLSGGDAQRVSLARAMVRRPKAFLMDEPLGQCDLHLRESLRDEIKRLHVGIGATTVYVTHDQAEALSLADVVVLMKDGDIQQVASPQDIYHRPANLFAAHFIGSPGMALIDGTVTSASPLRIDGVIAGAPLALTTPTTAVAGQDVVVGLRPEDIEIAPEVASGDRFAVGSVSLREHLGAFDLIDIDLGSSGAAAPTGTALVDARRILKCRTAPNAFAGATRVAFRVRDGRGVLFDRVTGKAV